jgi:hypothetical protein
MPDTSIRPPSSDPDGVFSFVVHAVDPGLDRFVGRIVRDGQVQPAEAQLSPAALLAFARRFPEATLRAMASEAVVAWRLRGTLAPSDADVPTPGAARDLPANVVDLAAARRAVDRIARTRLTLAGFAPAPRPGAAACGGTVDGCLALDPARAPDDADPHVASRAHLRPRPRPADHPAGEGCVALLATDVLGYDLLPAALFRRARGAAVPVDGPDR